MKILALETSCDETSAAVVEDGTKVLANIVTSSKKLHAKTGGIIPEVAAREQVKFIIPVIKEALAKSKADLKKDIDVIAVTLGPGLIGSLLVGVETAKTISQVAKKPVVGVNHIFAHIFANWLFLSRLKPAKENKTAICFPAIALVVSGGHTELFLMKSHQQLKWIGGTLDDAAGEAFDKTARLLGLAYPGGPEIAAKAAKLKAQNTSLDKSQNKKFKVKLPRPMIGSKDLNFSFSGLKTAVSREVKKAKEQNVWNEKTIQFFAYEIQESITDVLVKKTIVAANKHKVKSILLGGGVAANTRLKEKFQIEIKKNLQPTTYNLQLFIPPPQLCTDNAAYIASYAYFNFQPLPWEKIQAKPSLEVEV